METNVLYYGDNLDILRRYIPAESVDLVYLDPPFNSNRTYSAIFADESGRKSDAQIHAFEDSWHWGPTPEAHLAYLKNSTLHQGAVPVGVSQLLAALEFGIGKTPMLAYLVEMAVRLIELHRVLKPTGSLYLHCDPTASHYLKIVLDAIFGASRFSSEIIWKRTDAHNDAAQGGHRLGRIHDVILAYSRSDRPTFNALHQPLSQETADAWYVHHDEDGRRWNYGDLTAAKPGGDTLYEFHGARPADGRFWAYSREKMDQLMASGRIVFKKSGMPYMKRYLDESKGVQLPDLWTDIDMLRGWGGSAGERLGYPTQKPLALLERILQVSSNSGDIVLDPFCGCGTALVAAQKLGRRWIGIDITYLAVGVMRRRLADSFPELPPIHVEGEPTEVEGARLLATQLPEGRYQFQWWALDEVGALPASGDHKKGSDTGIDGRITFTGADGGLLQALVSVKSGKPKADDVRVLKAVCEREGAAIGIIVTLDEPTKPMKHEATIAGTYHSDVSGKDYPRIQILSVADLLERGLRPQLPPLVSAPLQRAAKVTAPVDQATLFGRGGRRLSQTRGTLLAAGSLLIGAALGSALQLQPGSLVLVGAIGGVCLVIGWIVGTGAARRRVSWLMTSTDRDDRLREYLGHELAAGSALLAEVAPLTTDIEKITSVEARAEEWATHVGDELDRRRPGWSALFLSNPIKVQYASQYRERDRVRNWLDQRVEALRALMERLG